MFKWTFATWEAYTEQIKTRVRHGLSLKPQTEYTEYIYILVLKSIFTYIVLTKVLLTNNYIGNYFT